MIDVKSISLSKLAQKMPSPKVDSAYKRLQRFIQEVVFCKGKLAYLLLKIAKIPRDKPMTLIFDRTNWKFGSKHINILFLSVVAQGLSIPVFFKFLIGKKCGNSNQVDRMELIEKFIKTFGKKNIGLILGDREFIGYKWLRYLRIRKIPFCVRLKEGWQKVSLPDGRMVEVKKCFNGLRKGEVRSLGQRQLGDGPSSVLCNITGMRNEKGDWIIVAHSEELENPCEIYRKRWQIETMFRAMKTGGFNIEDTHVIDPERIECLMGIVCITYALCYQLGQWVVEQEKPKLKKHGYQAKTLIKKGIEKLSHAMGLGTRRPEFKRMLRRLCSNIRLTKQSFVL